MDASVIPSLINGIQTASNFYEKLNNFESNHRRLCEISSDLVVSEVDGLDSVKKEFLALVDEGIRIQNMPFLLSVYKKVQFDGRLDKKLIMLQTQFLLKAVSQHIKMLGEILEKLKNGAGSNGETGNVDDHQIQASTMILEEMDTVQSQEEIDVNHYSSLNILDCLSLVKEIGVMMLDDCTPIVIISGPYSSAKTAFAKKLSQDRNLIGMFPGGIHYISVDGIPRDSVVAYLSGRVNYHSQIEGVDMNALREGIMSKARELFIIDDATREWLTILEKDFLPIPGCKILVLSNFKFQRFEGFDLSNLYDDNGQMLRVHSNRSNKHVEHGKASSSHDQPLLGWKKRLTNSHKGKSVMMYDDALEPPKKLHQVGTSSTPASRGLVLSQTIL